MILAEQPKVFISYRREETAGHAGRLYDVMSSHFGDANVFMDVDIAPGVDFVQRIKDAVGGCHVLIVIIGPRWSTITNGSIAPRLADPGDFVRLEVEEGLRRGNVTVIPVLVGGARMPGPSELPLELHPLSRRNALELSDTRWRYDVDRLMQALDGLLAGTSAVHQTPLPGAVPPVRQPAPPPTPQPREPREQWEPREPAAINRATLALSTTIVAVAAAIVGRAIAGGLRHRQEPYAKMLSTSGGHRHQVPDFSQITPAQQKAHILDAVFFGGFTWAVIVAAVAFWLALRLRNSSAAPGRLIVGALVGAVAGVAGSAVHALPSNIATGKGDARHFLVSGDQHRLVLVVGAAVTGAIVGAMVGWLWARRGSAGLAAGLVGGLVGEGAIVLTQSNGPNDSVAKAALLAFLIVGFVALTQALLDASVERSPRVLAASRGP